MTQSEFLAGLREALENELSGSVVQENVNYYKEYISGETRSGRSEEEVTAELGDPWAIARTIIDSLEGQNTANDSSTYEQKQNPYSQNRSSTGTTHVFGFNTWWKKLLLILGIIGVILIVIAVIGGIFSLLMPLLVPILIIMLVIRLIGGTRR